MSRRLNFGGHAPPSGTFGEMFRRARRPLTDAEHDALFAEYVESGQAARDHEYVASGQAARDERAFRAKRERERLTPALTSTARATPRTRERRDSGARQTVASGDDSDPGEPPALAAALGYAGRGWPVLILEPSSKEPKGNRKACPSGVHSATTDLDRLRSWFWRWPDSNIGVATGAPGPTVQDADDLTAAGPTIGRIAASVPRVLTPRTQPQEGGVHYYFRGLARGTVERGWGELRGRGSYVVAPPSVVDGRAYVWTVAPNGALPELPDFLVPAAGSGAGSGRQPIVRAVKPGEMYGHLADLAVRLARAGICNPDVIERVLLVEFEAMRLPDGDYGCQADGRRDTRRIAEWAATSDIARRERRRR